MIQCIHCVWDPPFLCEISLGSMGLSLINAASFALLSPWSHIVSDFTIIQPFLTIGLDLKQCMITWLLNFKIVKPRANIGPDLITLIHKGLFIYKNSQIFFFEKIKFSKSRPWGEIPKSSSLMDHQEIYAKLKEVGILKIPNVIKDILGDESLEI